MIGKTGRRTERVKAVIRLPKFGSGGPTILSDFDHSICLYASPAALVFCWAIKTTQTITLKSQSYEGDQEPAHWR